MPSTVRPERPAGLPGFAPVLLANLFPLVGVAVLGWNPETLVVVYALELLFSFPLAGVKALFAQRPVRSDREGSTVLDVESDLTGRCGSVVLVQWLPPVYPRNLPFVTAVVTTAVMFLIMLGVVLSNVMDVGAALGQSGVLVSLAGLVVGQSVETWRDYLRDGGYETASPYSVIETVAREAFFVTFALVITPGITAFGPTPVFGFLLFLKLFVEWSGHRASQGGGGRLTRWLAGPDASADSRDPVSVPDADPTVRVPVDRRGAFYTGLFDVLVTLAPFTAAPFVILWLITVGLFVDGSSPLVTAFSSVAVLTLYLGYLAANVVEFYLAYGPLEYRRHADRIVAYDTLVDEPQWSAPVDVLRDVHVVPDRLADRLFGTRTVVVTTGWDEADSERRLGPVADADALVEGFDLPVRTTDLDPVARAPVAVVLVISVGAVATVVALAVGPWASADDLLSGAVVYGWFAVPFFVLVLRGIWRLGYPERSD